jgi:ATP citrate (pro-S)-lyase
MAQRAIREYDGKRILHGWLAANASAPHDGRLAQVGPGVDLDALEAQHPWLASTPLAVKPDQLIKRRGKAGMLLLNADWAAAKAWLAVHRGRAVEVDGVRGVVDHFLVEPFVPHAPDDECYLCIRALRAGDEILFLARGGVEVGDVDAEARSLLVPVGEEPAPEQIARELLADLPEAQRPGLAAFIAALHRCFAELQFAYLESNPLVVGGGGIAPLDVAAKLDSAGAFEPGARWWGGLAFPPPFGRAPTPEEAFVEELDRRSGASLKLTVLNPSGRVWTLVAGGGASVVVADTVCALGHAAELANYGEYSGDPGEELTYAYARTVLDLMTRAPDPRGKVLLVSGGIANFTDVAATFKGIVRALREFAAPLSEQGVRVLVRRGGPNYQEGLMIMRDLGRTLGIPIEVYGPETHLTATVRLALVEGGR